LILALSAGAALAAEGMWPPRQLPELGSELKQLGLELGPKSLTRLTEHPMNAVIDLGGCTASFVSPKGLVVTNHHCAWGTLQYNSDGERNLMDDGFLAADFADELPATPGSRVRVTVEVRDVTEKITAAIEGLSSGAERFATIERREKELVAACEKDVGHRCRVRSFYGGLHYMLYKQLEIRDVRLVYAPPGSIGVFGGDIDNWMWPRHTGDFAFLRAYVGPDGKPADHAAENVPFEPKHWLRVAPGGVREHDFVMVVGYPGRTHRYRLADEVRSAFEWAYPTRKEMLDRALEIVAAQIERHPDVELKYATAVAGMNNAVKNYQGMIDGYAGSGMLERKRRLEEDLQAWIAGSEELKRRHLSTLEDLQTLVRRDQSTRERDLALGMMGRSAMLSTARRLYRLSREREQPDAEREPGFQERDMRPFRERLERLERRYHPEVDKALWRMRLETYLELPAEQRVAPLDAFLGLDDPSGLDAKLDRMYEETRLASKETRLALMEADRETLEASRDPFLRLAVAIYDSDIAREEEEEAMAGEFKLLRPRYMETMIAFLGAQGRPVYPDANGSLRVTFGAVQGCEPRDGLHYLPFTRLEGISEKYTGEKPFGSPPVQLELIAARDHGRYRLGAIDSVPVNFLSTLDTTGGNSGSPVLNGRGELVGLLFDGTYDGINADWDYHERKTRSIQVDIRYMLWVMEKVDGARRVLEELGL
jgi:hypothetical protein